MRAPSELQPHLNRLVLPAAQAVREAGRVWTEVRPVARVGALFAALVLSAVPGLVARHHGYSWSLSLFAGPSLIILVLYRKRRWLSEARRPLSTALALLVPMGVLLNLLFAGRFFVYPNRDAVVGVYLRGLSGGGAGIPVEEFAFYLLGFLALMLVYLWARHELYPWAPPPPAPARSRPLLGLVLSLAALLAACALKRALGGRGAPEYFVYLAGVPLPVTLAWLPKVRARVHWGAFAFVGMALLGVSVLWEVSLAVPNGWWGYRPGAMLGLFVAPWHGLPVEAVAVWFLSALSAVVTLETAQARALRTTAAPRGRTEGGAARR
jgi:hypothetical protein